MTFVGCRIEALLREQIEKWSHDRKLDLSYALRRSIEIGWPVFLENNFHGLEMRPKEDYTK
jgi:hypothetical protein